MEKLLRILLIVNFFIFIQTDLFSQKKSKTSKKDKGDVEQADRYFNNEEYYLASQEYNKILQSDPENKYALYKFAESERMFFNYEVAERNYKLLLDKGGESEYPLTPLWYALMLKLNGKYEEAKENLQKFLDSGYTGDNAQSYEDLARNELGGCDVALLKMKEPQKDYTFENLKGPVNSGVSDYSPCIYENDSSIVIASARQEAKGKEEFNFLGGEFSDNFRFQKGDKDWVPKSDDDKFSIVNTEYNESPGSFTKDKQKFYFTRCDEVVMQNDVEIHECAIYVTSIKNGKWEKAVRLNENINTKGEWNAQPSISPNGDTLFFVSKRVGGYGMHDIWMSTSSGKDDWGAAVNLGPEINTAFIDMSPKYYPKENTLFYASNGKEGFGGLDIYIAKGKGFKEVTNAGLPFNSNRDDFYFVLGEKKGYLASNREGGMGNDDIYWFNIKAKESVIATINKDSLEDAKSISLVGTMKEKETGDPATDLGVVLKDNKDEVVKKTSTDDEGLFRFENLQPDNYKVSMENFDSSLTSDVKYVVDKVQVKKSQQVSTRKLFENIYFDFDKYVLRPEAKKVLDDLVEYYKANPEIQIEMNANTDAFGSDGYNVHLSHQRGRTSLDYLIRKGVKKSALVINAKGEGQPIATNNNPAGRQLNRRVEFYIVGGPGYEAKAMAYVVEPKTTLYSVAKKFNMTVDELKQLNGLQDEKILAYRPLRVRRPGDNDIIAPSTMSYAQSAPRTDFPDANAMTSNKEEKVKPKQEQRSEKVRNTRAPQEDQDFNSEKQRPKEENHQQTVIASNTSSGSTQYYFVKEGDVLFSIAEKYGMSVDELKQLNSLKSNKLYVNQRLKVKVNPRLKADPDALYTVKNGDTMFLIAKKFGLSVEELKELNNLKDNRLYENMVLRVKR